jgi:hypothetical protein
MTWPPFPSRLPSSIVLVRRQTGDVSPFNIGGVLKMQGSMDALIFARAARDYPRDVTWLCLAALCEIADPVVSKIVRIARVD